MIGVLSSFVRLMILATENLGMICLDSVCDGMPGAGLQSQQWGRKVSAAKAVKALCELGGNGSLAQNAASIARDLLQVRLRISGNFSACGTHPH